MKKKFEQIRQRGPESNVRGIIITLRPNFNWLFDFIPLADERPCFACMTLTDLVFFVLALNFEQLSASVNNSFYVWNDESGPHIAFRNLVFGPSQKKIEKVVVIPSKGAQVPCNFRRDLFVVS